MEKEKMSSQEKKSEGLASETEKVITPKASEADRLWQEISSTKVDMFSLPNQTVEMHASPVQVEPSALYVQLKSPAAFPAIDQVLSARYDLEQVDRFIKITRKS